MVADSERGGVAVSKTAERPDGHPSRQPLSDSSVRPNGRPPSCGGARALSISCFRESIPCHREFFFASSDRQPTGRCTGGRRALRPWGGDCRYRDKRKHIPTRKETDSAFQGRSPLDEPGGSHKCWTQAVEYHCPAIGKARGFIGFMLHFLRCKLFAKRQIHTVSKAACFRSRKDGAATDGTPMNHGPAPAAGARRKPPGGADCGDRALW